MLSYFWHRPEQMPIGTRSNGRFGVDFPAHSRTALGRSVTRPLTGRWRYTSVCFAVSRASYLDSKVADCTFQLRVTEVRRLLLSIRPAAAHALLPVSTMILPSMISTA